MTITALDRDKTGKMEWAAGDNGLAALASAVASIRVLRISHRAGFATMARGTRRMSRAYFLGNYRIVQNKRLALDNTFGVAQLGFWGFYTIKRTVGYNGMPSSRCNYGSVGYNCSWVPWY